MNLYIKQKQTHRRKTYVTKGERVGRGKRGCGLTYTLTYIKHKTNTYCIEQETIFNIL